MCENMVTIVRGTTPAHIFTFDTDLWEVQIVEITYSQNGEDLIQLSKDDLILSPDGLSAEYTLTQEQTFLFKTGETVSTASVQGRVMKADGSVVASDIIYLNIADVLSDEVLGGE